MNTDEIIETAIQGHASTRDAIRWAIKQEREACAKVCDDLLFRIIRKPHCFDMAGPKECAEFIRARGNA